MTTSKIIYIVIIISELLGLLLFAINLRAFLELYTDLCHVLRRVLCVIGFIMALIGAIIFFLL